MPSGSPRVFWSLKADRNIETDPWDKEGLLQRIKKTSGTDKFAFCIIENITKDWIDYLESDHGLHLDPNFCLDHASNQYRISKVHTWLWAGGSFPKTANQKLEEKQKWRHIEGAYLLRDKEVWTRLSYRRITERIYLFLVDGPPSFAARKSKGANGRGQTGRERISLRFRYSMRSAGLLLPAIFSERTRPYDLFSFMKESMNHSWVHNYLSTKVNGYDSAIRAHPLLYIMADAFWTRNLQHLEKTVKDISFDGNKTSTDGSDKKLYKLREDLDFLKTEIKQTLRFAPPGLEEYFKSGGAREHASATTEAPLQYLQHIAEEAAVLEEFLTNSLNFLLASIALESNQRVDKLTWLAAIYIPLSFVTGIFGMNLRELNDSSLPIWVCFEVLAVVLVLTIVLVWSYDHCVRNRGREERGG